MSRPLTPERFHRRLVALGWRQEAATYPGDRSNWYTHDHPELAGVEVCIRATLPLGEQLATLVRLLQEADARHHGGRFLRKSCTPPRDYAIAAETFGDASGGAW